MVFDYIVIGAGTAGSTVAGRLCEEKGWNVLVIEAGGDLPPESDVSLPYKLIIKRF